jgi:hypothetical protein
MRTTTASRVSLGLGDDMCGARFGPVDFTGEMNEGTTPSGQTSTICLWAEASPQRIGQPDISNFQTDRANDKSKNIARIGLALLATIFDPISYPLRCCHPVQIRMRQAPQTGPVAYPSCCCLAFVGQETN